MDPSTIDLGPLSDLTPLGVLSLTALITFVDVAVAYALAVAQRKFDLSYVAVWLVSHSMLRIVPIYAMLILGVGIPAVQIPAVPAIFSLSVAGVIAYFLETVKSVLVNWADARARGDESPVPPPGPVNDVTPPG